MRISDWVQTCALPIYGGGFLRRLGPLDAHGYADIGLLERRRIVDAVAGHGDNLALRLQSANDAKLVLWAGPCEDRAAVDDPFEGPLRKRLDIQHGHHLRAVCEINLATNSLGDRRRGARWHIYKSR